MGNAVAEEGRVGEIDDPRFAGQIKPESLRKFGDTIEKCLAEFWVDRPSMGDVLWNLEYVLQLQEALSERELNENSLNGSVPQAPLRLKLSFTLERRDQLRGMVQ